MPGNDLTSLLDEIDRTPVVPAPAPHPSPTPVPPQTAGGGPLAAVLDDIDRTPAQIRPARSPRPGDAVMSPISDFDYYTGKAEALLAAPGAAWRDTKADLVRGVGGAVHATGIPGGDKVAEFLNDFASASKEESERETAISPTAQAIEHGGEFAGSMAPALLPGVGVPIMATTMAGNANEDALASGATPNQARLAAGLMGLLGAAGPEAGKLIEPEAKAAGAAIADQLGPRVGGFAERGAHGAATGTAFDLGTPLVMSTYDPDQAKEQLADVGKGAGLLGLLDALGGAAAGRTAPAIADPSLLDSLAAFAPENAQHQVVDPSRPSETIPTPSPTVEDPNAAPPAPAPVPLPEEGLGRLGVAIAREGEGQAQGEGARPVEGRQQAEPVREEVPAAGEGPEGGDRLPAERSGADGGPGGGSDGEPGAGIGREDRTAGEGREADEAGAGEEAAVRPEVAPGPASPGEVAARLAEAAGAPRELANDLGLAAEERAHLEHMTKRGARVRTRDLGRRIGQPGVPDHEGTIIEPAPTLAGDAPVKVRWDNGHEGVVDAMDIDPAPAAADDRIEETRNADAPPEAQGERPLSPAGEGAPAEAAPGAGGREAGAETAGVAPRSGRPRPFVTEETASPARRAGPRSMDLLDEIREAGGIQSKPKGYRGQEYDDQPPIFGAHRRILGGAHPPDAMAAMMHRRGYGDGTVNTLWKAIDQAIRARKSRGEVEAPESAPVAEGRPDLALPSTDLGVRQSMREVDEGRATDVISHEHTRAEADRRLTADRAGEQAKLEEKMRAGQPLDAQETVMASRLAEDAFRSGDNVTAARLFDGYRRGRSEQARALGIGYDPLETPAQRAGRMVRENLLTPPQAIERRIAAAKEAGNEAERTRLVEAWGKQVDRLKQKLRSLGIDPDTFETIAPKSKVERAQAGIKRTRQKLDSDFHALAKRAKDLFTGKGGPSAGALGGEMVDVLTKMALNRIESGVLKFADVALSIAKAIPELRHNADAKRALEEAWAKARESHPELAAEANADEALKRATRTPKVLSLEEKIEREQKRLAKMEDYWRKRATAGKPVVEPEIQKLRQEANSRIGKLRSAVIAAEKAANPPPPPTLEERIEAEEKRTAAMTKKWVDEHAKSTSMTDEQRLAYLKEQAAKRALPPQVERIRAAAEQRIKALRDQVQTRDRELVDAEKPEPSLEEQVAEAKKRSQDLADRWAQKHAEAMAMTPAQRLEWLQKQAEAKKLPPEIEAARAENDAKAKDLQKQVGARDRIIIENADRALNLIHIAKADKWDVAYEYWRSALHTSLQLPLVKVGSDAANLAYRMMLSRPLEALLNVATRSKNGATFGEVPHVLHGIFPGLSRAFTVALKSWKNESHGFDQEVFNAHAEKAFREGTRVPDEIQSPFHQRPAIGGMTGKAVRWNIRLIGALQGFMQAFAAHLDVGAQAYRSALDADGKRLTGDALRAHMDREVSDLTSPSWQKAVETSRGITYVDRAAGTAKDIQRIKNMDVETGYDRAKKELFRYLFPFPGIPTSIAMKATKTSPLGSLLLAWRSGKHVLSLATGKGEWRYKAEDFNRDAAEQILAWGTTLALGAYMQGKDGLPNITGFGGGFDPSSRDRNAPPPTSIRLGGKYYDYSKFGAPGHALALMADMVHSYQDMKAGGSAVNAVSSLVGSMKQGIIDEFGMRAVHDLMEGMSSGPSFAKFAGNFASTWVPTMFRQAGAATDDHQEERRQKEGSFWSRFGQVVKQRLEIPGTHELPAVDLWGREIPKGGGPIPGTDWLFRVTSPSQQTGDVDRIPQLSRLIINWNNQHPDQKLLPKQPDASFEFRGKKVEMTAQQYHDFLVERGRIASEVLGRSKLDVEHPTSANVQVINHVFDQATSVAHRKLLMEMGMGSKR